MDKKDGMTYAPKGMPNPVVNPGEFLIAAVGLDHGHVYGMVNGLTEAGADLKWVYDPDPEKVREFLIRNPNAIPAESEEQVLEDPEIRLVAGAAVPSDRAGLGIRVMRAGKDYFTDKPPLTTMEQLNEVRHVTEETGKKYTCYFSERLHTESAIFAENLIRDGVIGKVIQTIGLGPHRINAPTRPDWFFQKDRYGGILCDIGSHQIEQFLFYTGNENATVLSSKVGNYNNPEHPGLDDFGDATLVGENGATGYFRVDWFTPDGLSSWGDGRTFILGTEGYIELRKYVDVAHGPARDSVYWVDKDGEHHLNVSGQVGYPFFGQLILDCLNRTENAMTQEHIFTASELCIKAQQMAVKVK